MVQHHETRTYRGTDMQRKFLHDDREYQQTLYILRVTWKMGLYDEVFAYTNDVDGMMLHYVMHEYEDSWFADQFIWPELDEYRQTFTTLPMRVTHYE